MFDLTFAYLVLPVVGITGGLTSMFPKLLGPIKPIVAFLVALLLYLAVTELDPRLFGLLIATGSGMGLYTLAGKLGEINIKQ